MVFVDIGWQILCPIAGTERCNEALEKLAAKYDIVVNIQGDEPLIEPAIIDGIVLALQVCYELQCTSTPDRLSKSSIAGLARV